MESAIQASSTLTGKVNIVNDLINIKVHAPSNVDFSPEVSDLRLTLLVTFGSNFFDCYKHVNVYWHFS